MLNHIEHREFRYLLLEHSVFENLFSNIHSEVGVTIMIDMNKFYDNLYKSLSNGG